jgi:hypothetical protein
MQAVQSDTGVSIQVERCAPAGHVNHEIFWTNLLPHKVSVRRISSGRPA